MHFEHVNACSSSASLNDEQYFPISHGVGQGGSYCNALYLLQGSYLIYELFITIYKLLIRLVQTTHNVDLLT